MLRGKFGQVVHWVISPEAQSETWRRLFNGITGWDDPDPQLVRLREQFIRDRAARAVEWTWNRSPDERRAFIESEMAAGGYVFPVTADEIFDYSEKHLQELLPKRVDPASGTALDALHRSSPLTFEQG